MPEIAHILVVRLGAMGDIVHTLPAAASLKLSFPKSFLTWVIEPRWMPLLEGNPFVDRVIPFDRRSLSAILSARRDLRSMQVDLAVDFQGLIKSAMVASAARPERLYGYHGTHARERQAAWFYSHPVATRTVHIVDQHLELARAAGASADIREFPLPPGRPEGDLPETPFVLANPLAGWASKQWPLSSYEELAARLRAELGLALVLNGAPNSPIASVHGAVPHYSGLSGLIYATRKAAAVVGVDSGPLHLAAALGKQGVAIFGPTDPARNGPYGGTIRVLRTAAAVTSYKRLPEIDSSMRAITPAQVFDTLKSVLEPVRQI